MHVCGRGRFEYLYPYLCKRVVVVIAAAAGCWPVRSPLCHCVCVMGCLCVVRCVVPVVPSCHCDCELSQADTHTGCTGGSKRHCFARQK